MGGVWSWAHLSRSPVLRNESFLRGAILRDHPAARSAYLVARAAGDRSRRPERVHARSESIAPRNRTVPSSTRTALCATALLPSMAVAPSMEVAWLQPKSRCDGERGTPRATIACPVSGKDLVPPSILRSQRTAAGMGPGVLLPSPHPGGRVSAASSWSLLSSWHRPWEPPRIANVSSTALQRFLPGFASPLPGTTRGHGPRRTRSSLPVSGVSSSSLYFHEADCCLAPGDQTRRPETFPV